MPYAFKGLLMAIAATLTFTVAGMRQAHADPVVLTFDGLQGGEPILNFYNGGSGGSGSGPGPNFGVTFSSNAVILAGSNPIFFFRPPSPVVANLPGGFVSELSFLASSGTPFPSVTVSAYEGLNGSGNLLGQVSSIETGIGINLQPYSFSFSGTARSIVFVGLPSFAAFDSITFTPAQAAAVPEPATLVLLGTGLAGVGAVVRRWRKAGRSEAA